MPIPRRRLLQTIATAAALSPPAPAQTPSSLSAERVARLEPILKIRRTQLQALRDFEIDDLIAPIRGPLAP
ncbi:MAG: hypothetical protein ABI972_17900 [Acidobacteriota bacterium]